MTTSIPAAGARAPDQRLSSTTQNAPRTASSEAHPETASRSGRYEPADGFDGTGPSGSISERLASRSVARVDRITNPQAFDGSYGGAPDARRPNELTFYDPNTTSIDAIPAVQPRGRPNNGVTVYFVNGIDTDPALAYRWAQATADQTGAQVRAIYNAPESIGDDLSQSVEDLYGAPGNNAASRTLGNMIYNKLAAGQPVHLFAESQGAIVARNGLELAIQRFKADGLSDAEIENRLDNVIVETFNGAVPGPLQDSKIRGLARTALRQLNPLFPPLFDRFIDSALQPRGFPDGPVYIHYGNTRDSVFTEVGLGQDGAEEFAGEGAVIRTVTEGSLTTPLENHFYGNLIDNRVPWDQANPR